MGSETHPLLRSWPSVPKFLEPLLTALRFDQATKFSTVTHIGDGCFSKDQSRPYPYVPNISWDPLRAHGMRNSSPNQIWNGDQTILQENFYAVDHAICSGQKFVWRKCWRAICLR